MQIAEDYVNDWITKIPGPAAGRTGKGTRDDYRKGGRATATATTATPSNG